MNIILTAAAEKFMQRMVRFGGEGVTGFRLQVSPGGCSGVTSEFSVEQSPRQGDAVLECNGFKLFLPVESRLLLEGATVGFAETATESGLTFRNVAGAGNCSSTTATPAVAVSAIVRRVQPNGQ